DKSDVPGRTTGADLTYKATPSRGRSPPRDAQSDPPRSGVEVDRIARGRSSARSPTDPLLKGALMGTRLFTKRLAGSGATLALLGGLAVNTHRSVWPGRARGAGDARRPIIRDSI